MQDASCQQCSTRHEGDRAAGALGASVQWGLVFPTRDLGEELCVIVTGKGGCQDLSQGYGSGTWARGIHHTLQANNVKRGALGAPYHCF